MGWVENSYADYDESSIFSTTRMHETSQCTTEEVKPGKFVRKCVKTKKVLVRRRLWNWLKMPSEEVKCSTEKTEEDVTEQVLLGRSTRPSNFEEKSSLSIRLGAIRLGPLLITPLPFSIKLV